MTTFHFQGFGNQPAERARIENVIRQLRLTEVGRLFLSRMPPRVTFRYHKGDKGSRASADSLLDRIVVPQNTFDSRFDTYQTMIHELAHLLQSTRQLDLDIRGLLEGAHGILVKHRNDRRFAWVAAPLKQLTTEETLAQDIVSLIFRLGYGRAYTDHYYIPGDGAVPPSGTLRPTLTAQDRLTFERVMRKLGANALSGEELRSNLRAYEEFYRRALSAGWVGSDERFRARLDAMRRQRGANATSR